MGEAFFTDVAGPIPYGGPDSANPLAFKVYEPDRLVLGKRMEDHLRIAVCLWHSFNWPGSDVFGVGHLRPALARRRRSTRLEAARTKLDAAFEFLDEARRPVLLLPRSRRRARRDGTFAETTAILDAVVDDDRGPHGADRRPAAVGHGEPVQPPALRGRRGDQPRPRGVRLRGRAGQAHARGDASARRRELRPVGRPRGLRDAAQHRPRARGSASSRGSCTLVAEHKHQDRVRGHAAPRAEAAGADEAPVRLRLRDGPRLPRPPRPRGRVPRQPRGQPRHARRPQLPPRGRRTRSRTGSSAASTPTAATTRTAGTPTSSRTRSTSSRSPSTRSSAPAGSRPAASTSTPSSAARASTGPTCSTPTSAASTRSRGRCSSRPTWSRPATSSDARERATPAGPRASAREILGGDASLETSRPASPQARSTRGRARAARSGSRTSSTSGSGRPTARSDSIAVGRAARPRHRRLDDRDEGRPRRRGRARSSASAPPSTTSTSRGRSGASRTRGLWWDGAIAAIRSALAEHRRRRRRRRRGRADRPDARARPARRRRPASCGRRSSGTTSARPPRATRSARRSAASG